MEFSTENPLSAMKELNNEQIYVFSAFANFSVISLFFYTSIQGELRLNEHEHNPSFWIMFQVVDNGFIFISSWFVQFRLRINSIFHELAHQRTTLR